MTYDKPLAVKIYYWGKLLLFTTITLITILLLTTQRGDVSADAFLGMLTITTAVGALFYRYSKLLSTTPSVNVTNSLFVVGVLLFLIFASATLLNPSPFLTGSLVGIVGFTLGMMLVRYLKNVVKEEPDDHTDW